MCRSSDADSLIAPVTPYYPLALAYASSALECVVGECFTKIDVNGKPEAHVRGRRRAANATRRTVFSKSNRALGDLVLEHYAHAGRDTSRGSEYSVKGRFAHVSKCL